jgi:ankyrin repeat protein
MTNWTSTSSSMNNVLNAFFVFCVGLLVGACDAGAQDAASCALLKAPVSNARILDAIQQGKVHTLVACGLDPNGAIPVEGSTITPLQFAASSGRAELVRQVIKAGADPNFAGRGDDPLPPLELALSTRKYEAASALLELGARADYAVPRSQAGALMALAFDDRVDGPAAQMADALIQRGAPVNGADTRGNTALHWGARAGNLELSRVLLQRGADACARNHKGERAADVVNDKASPMLRQALSSACTARKGP